MWEKIFIAACLMLVIEGILPFLSPSLWRQMMLNVAAMPDSQIRNIGLVSMLLGAALLFFIN